MARGSNKKAPETAPTAPVQENTAPETIAAPGPEYVQVRARVRDMWHPFQELMIPTGRAIPVVLDGWVRSQLAERLLVKR